MAEGSVATTFEGLLAWRARCDLSPGTRVALESGTMAFFVARTLSAMGLDPLVVDAREVRAKALRPNQKSDRRDAIELCEGLRRGSYRTVVHVPPQEIEQLREALGRRRHFVRVKTMQVNAVKRLLRSTGQQHLTRRLSSERGWKKLLGAVTVDSLLHAFCVAHRAVWQCAHDQVVALEASLAELQRPFQRDVERLQTAPGVGPIVALTVLAAFSDVRRFPSAKHAASDSGDRIRHGHITRRGSSELRSMLCEAAHHAWRRSSPFYPLFANLCVRRGYKMAVVAVAHRLCRILFAMLRDGAEFSLARVGIEEGRFERTTVHRYRRTSPVTAAV